LIDLLTASKHEVESSLILIGGLAFKSEEN